ncbi:MAG TPA: peptidoglycan editing factor PgeF [Pseudonocardia sp.]|nr:peptidoglycan editing factor PgeF [Pseudonocardia sp.]
MSDRPDAARVRRVVTTRAGGASTGPYASFNLSAGVGDDPRAVAANRRRLADALGVRAVVFLEQVHGVRVAGVDEVPASDAPDVPATDAAVTALPGVALAVLAADCVPVLLGDPEAGVVGAAHAGRVGAAGGVVPAVLEAMTTRGARIGAVEVLLGPAVCGACYEVPAPMRAEVGAALPGSAARSRRGTPSLDLRAGLYRQLADLGVARIGVDPRCTAEDPQLYSHRREGRTGRLAGVVWLDPSRPGAA